MTRFAIYSNIHCLISDTFGTNIATTLLRRDLKALKELFYKNKYIKYINKDK